MGSFNTTCMITSTPIKRNQKARVFFLIWNSFDYHYSKRSKGLFSLSEMSTFNYPYEHFSIVGLPLLAQYFEDENGDYVFLEKEKEEMVLNSIKDLYVKNTVQENFDIKNYNNSHDYLDFELNNMKDVQDMIHSGALRVKSHHGLSYITKVAIHEDIYQYIINSHKDNDDKNNKELKQEYMDGLKVNLENHNKLIELDNEFDSLKEKNLSKDELSLAQKEYQKKISSLVLKSFDFDIFEFKRYIYSPSRLIEYLKENQKELESYSQDLADLNILNCWLEDNNMHYHQKPLASFDYDKEEKINTLENFAKIIDSLDEDYFSEYVPVKKEVRINKSICLKDTLVFIEDFFESESEELLEIKSIIKKIKDNKVKSFIIGDNSDFDKFSKTHELFYEEKDGSTINFNY